MIEMNLARKGLTPAGHVSSSDLIGQTGTDGDGFRCQVVLKLD